MVTATSSKFVSYRRVSTKRQGNSGLGLEAQQEYIRRYIEKVPGAEVVADYTEIESGANCHRVELQKALDHARRIGGTLIIAKLDRLTRDLEFTAKMCKGDVPFVICDLPGANKMMIQMMGIMAEQEREMISQRTKDGLAAAKARGVLLGSARPGHWKGKEHIRTLALRKAVRNSAAARREQLHGLFGELAKRADRLHKQGVPYHKIAASFNEEKLLRENGVPWDKVSICRLLQRERMYARSKGEDV